MKRPEMRNATGKPKASPRVARPFDQWLQKQLHEMYDSIAQEPLPDDLIELVTPTKNSKP